MSELKFKPLKCPSCGQNWAECPHLTWDAAPEPWFQVWVMGAGVTLLVLAAIVGLIVVPLMVMFG